MNRLLGLLLALMTLTGCGYELVKVEEELLPYNVCEYLPDYYSNDLLIDGFEIVSCGEMVNEIRSLDTGVHYYLMYTGNGTSSKGGLTPVYNSDGDIRITN